LSGYISFSELKDWKFCPYYRKLTRDDGLAGFKGNEFTTFGTAIHSACEKMMLNENIVPIDFFLKEFDKEISNLDDDVEIDLSLVDQMKDQASNILPYVMDAVSREFGNYEVVSTEEKLMVPIEEQNYDFKGFIDLVVKTEDGKYHIIDWKTCSWGWDAKKRSDPMVTYQLTLYKKYFAIKHNIEPDNIETHFILLKRTAKKDNVELVTVTSGAVKTRNATNLLITAIKNIKSGKSMKNRLSCRKCQFYKTEHCT